MAGHARPTGEGGDAPPSMVEAFCGDCRFDDAVGCAQDDIFGVRNLFLDSVHALLEHIDHHRNCSQ